MSVTLWIIVTVGLIFLTVIVVSLIAHAQGAQKKCEEKKQHTQWYVSEGHGGDAGH